MDESPIALLDRSGRKYKLRGSEARLECPCCGSSEGFDVNIKSGLWKCKRASCSRAGNLYQLAVAMGLALEVEPQESPRERLIAAFESRPATQHDRWLYALQGDERAHAAREYLAKRGISQRTCTIATVGWVPTHPKAKSPERMVGNGCITIPYFEPSDRRSPVMVKLRWVPPEPMRKGKPLRYQRIAGGESILFCPNGFDPAKPVILCGGELDALSVVEACIESGCEPTEIPWCAVSVPDGESWTEVLTEHLAECEDIVIAFDNDKAGRRGAREVSKRLGTWRCRVASWPDGHADANDALVAGALDIFTLTTMTSQAKSVAASGIHNAGAYEDAVVSYLFGSEGANGRPTGIESLDELLAGGWRDGETTLLTASTSSGKSTLATQFAEVQRAQGNLVLYCPFEGGPRKQLVKSLRTYMGEDPTQQTEQAIRTSLRRMGSHLLVLDHTGAVDPDVFKATVSYAIGRLGVRFLVVDHLDFMYPRSARDVYAIKDQHIMNLVECTIETGCHTLLISHIKATYGKGAAVDDVLPQLADIKGHTTAVQDVDNVLSLYRPRSADRVQERFDGLAPAAMVVLKARFDPAQEGWLGLHFDESRGVYLGESERAKLLRCAHSPEFSHGGENPT